jgi:hypothetical protein
MGVFPNENAAERLFQDSQSQEKFSSGCSLADVSKTRIPFGNDKQP